MGIDMVIDMDMHMHDMDMHIHIDMDPDRCELLLTGLTLHSSRSP